MYLFYNNHETPNQTYFLLVVAARKLSLVGDLPGANVKSYAGYLTVNKKYNSNLFFWFFPALMVGSHFFFITGTFQITELYYCRCCRLREVTRGRKKILS